MLQTARVFMGKKWWNRELTLKCQLKCCVKPMKDSLGVGPSKGNQGTTRGKEKILLTSVGIEPTTSGSNLPLLCRLSYERNLSSFSLSIDPVEGDGDCTFRSIIKQLRNMLEWNDANTKLTEPLEDLGLTGANLDDDVFTLRQLFVDNVQSNEYYQMLLGISKEELNTETERFREQGTFSGEVGDLVMKVCSDLLQIPLPFIPCQVVASSTLYVAFNAFGPDHYDRTRPVTRVQGKH